MVWEPFYNREYSVTDLDDVSGAYRLIMEVSVRLNCEVGSGTASERSGALLLRFGGCDAPAVPESVR